MPAVRHDTGVSKQRVAQWYWGHWLSPPPCLAELYPAREENAALGSGTAQGYYGSNSTDLKITPAPALQCMPQHLFLAPDLLIAHTTKATVKRRRQTGINTQ